MAWHGMVLTSSSHNDDKEVKFIPMRFEISAEPQGQHLNHHFHQVNEEEKSETNLKKVTPCPKVIVQSSQNCIPT